MKKIDTPVNEILNKLEECYNRELWRDGLIDFAGWLIENKEHYLYKEKLGIIKAYGMGKLAKSKTPVIDGEAEEYYLSTIKTKTPTD